MTIIRSISFHTGERDDDYDFMVMSYTHRPDQVFQLHAHDFIEFVYIADGSGEHHYKDESYRIRKGDVFIIEPGKVHSYQVDPGCVLMIYNVMFYPKLLQHDLEALSKINSFLDFFYVEPFLRSSNQFRDKLSLQPVNQLEMITHLEKLLMEYNERKSGYKSVIKAKLIELLVFVSRCYEDLLAKPMMTEATEAQVMDRITNFIAIHYNQPLTLAQVSQMCGMSHTSFSNKFKMHAGKTFIEFRNQVRIENACKLLTESDDKIVSIALQVGFDDLSFFNRVFKQTTGMSPGRYREAFSH